MRSDIAPSQGGMSYLQTFVDSCCETVRLQYCQPQAVLAMMSQATCCLFQVIGFDIDAITMNVHPLYSYWDEERDSVDFPLDDGGSSNDDSYDDMDFSNYSFINDIWNRRDDWEVAAKTVAVIPFACLAVFGNLAVIRVIVKADLYKNPVNMFILNMSISDLIVALIFPWVILVDDLYQSYHLGGFICKAQGFILVTMMLSSIFSLTAISFDRLQAVAFPFRPRMDRGRAKIVIWGVWISAALIACPLFIWRSYHERQWLDFDEKWCREDKKALRLYWVVLMSLLIYVPLGVLTLTYSCILIKLDTLEKRQRDHPAAIKKKSKVVRMLFAIVILFVICWTPFTVFTYMRVIQSDTTANPPWLRNVMFVAHYLMFVNSALNPIVYGLKNDNLKREIRLAIPAFMRRAKETCDISTVSPKKRPKNQKTPGNHDAGWALKNRGLTEDGIFQPSDKPILKPSYLGFTFEDDSSSPASVMSIQRKNSALEDLGIFVSLST